MSQFKSLKEHTEQVLKEYNEPEQYQANRMSTYEFDAAGLHLEIVFDPPDVIIHLYRYSRWPDNLNQKLRLVLDKLINDTYTYGYEEVLDSWFIRIFDFAKSRADAYRGAISLAEEIAKLVTK